MTKLSPIESEFESTEAAEAYDAWFRAKVEKAMASTAPRIPHDEVMARMQAILDRRKAG
ncbi:stability determinant [Sphingomonas sp. CJ20]